MLKNIATELHEGGGDDALKPAGDLKALMHWKPAGDLKALLIHLQGG